MLASVKLGTMRKCVVPRRSKQPKPDASPDAAPPVGDAAGVVQVKVWLLGISPMVWRAWFKDG